MRVIYLNDCYEKEEAMMRAWIRSHVRSALNIGPRS